MNEDSTRQRLVSLFAELLLLTPDVRVGQLTAHLAFLAEDESGKSVSELEDEEMLSVLERHQRELQARKHAVM